MFWRRLGYLLATVGSVVFYCAYREWVSGVLMVFVLGLPLVSLVVSLPSMIMARLKLHGPQAVELGQSCRLQWKVSCMLPVGTVTGRQLLRNVQTGRSVRLRSGEALPTEHCGGWEITPKRVWIQDYMGLFSLPLWKKEGTAVLVRPKTIAMPEPPDVQRYRACAFRPKAGGGFSEQHELRLYRPGDQLRQVHWKLSAKAGKLVIREPMEPLRGKALVTMYLTGSEGELDIKLGKLLWLSLWLLEQQIPHGIQCLTGKGMQTLAVDTPEDAQKAVDTLLRCPLADGKRAAEFAAASWRYHIGGEGNEG